MHKLRFIFTKGGPAAFLSHLDVMRTFARSFQRAGIPLRHTEGFNPHPCLSIAHPLPVGFTGINEILDCEVIRYDPGLLAEKLNASLPEGLEVRSAAVPVKPVSAIAYAEYQITYSYDSGAPGDACERLGSFFASPTVEAVKKGRKGPAMINLADHIGRIEFVPVSADEISVKLLLEVREAPLNPKLFTGAIPDPDLRPGFAKYRRIAFYDSDMKLFR